jgi:hypothetical protein
MLATQEAHSVGVTKKLQQCPKPVQIKSSHSRDLRNCLHVWWVADCLITAVFSIGCVMFGIFLQEENSLGRKIASHPENHFHTISTVGIPMISMRIDDLSGGQLR